MSDNQKSAGGVPTTGHVWDDDLSDYSNQPPKWWMIGLAASALWVVVYWTIYPAIPFATTGTHFAGIGLPGLNLQLPGTDAKDANKWTAIKELAIDQKVLDDVRGKYENKLKDMTPRPEHLRRSRLLLRPHRLGGQRPARRRHRRGARRRDDHRRRGSRRRGAQRRVRLVDLGRRQAGDLHGVPARHRAADRRRLLAAR